ncbi:adenosylcobinamide-phosphate synthase CbiB [Rhodoplanes sp. TEM]|uniref:Cobalamin biosynthesis protein CobD n=1 Tax=Rhodoplanes tepidamans TaxID=200616 RepID=A0ABT5JJP6_RHOTP|nr:MULTISPECIES: adenosylcobinamide-phosphate synthase CbiB [Rhodoplanes]MDC7789529.1 adenosylcobinamide-phosphate synthase CbiB [Rhodoplanes tepidamans]MDC7987725.1 adenosylcobinamide-phosphate synthase CbiB [Rhodoplanes sp. TEM]MDQ0354007.1 adenosylcobinamide-phosphate synthase [Rhodoplanes tepidamans]
MLDLSDRLIVLVLAAALEAWAGYPDALFQRIGHPVSWLGALIAALDRGLNRPAWPEAARRTAGVATVAVLLGVSVAAGLALDGAAQAARPLGLVVSIAAVAVLIAAGSLDRHVGAVARALDAEGLDSARREVAKIVGRDPATLDEAAVCRAAIESLAENASDGVTAPAFWFLALGLPGMLAYKAVNTADSMIGHRTARHGAFGWAAARLDDLVNLPASRLTGLMLVAAAAVVPGASARGAWTAMRRDAGKHTSPNAGWPEAAMAGALGLRLAGPRIYAGTRVEAAWMGDGRADATAADVHRAILLYRVAFGGTAALVGATAVMAM